MTANAFRFSGRLRLFVAVTGIALLEASCGQQSDLQTQSTRTLHAITT